MLETMLAELAAGEGADLLVSAGSNIVTKCKDDHHWKKVFVNAGKFFIEHERYAEQIFDDISLVLSKENMLELAKALKHEDGYSIKNKLLDKLIELMDGYDIPHDIAKSYANGFLYTILEQLREIEPQKYEHYFQQDWRDEQNAFLATISEKIDRVNHELQKYHEQKIEIYSADEMDIRLREKTANPKIGISFFDVDDDTFKKSFDIHRYDNSVYVKGKCSEEVLYCVLNELWALKDERAIFIVERYEDWERLRQVSSTGNIYIPRFYRDEIVSIDGNTNIFIYSENMPVFSHNVITLRPRTHATISHALCRAGMDINEANRLVAETHGLYIPMKKKIFNGAYMKTPGWIAGISDRIKKTCLLVGQWTEADGDKAIIENLSGYKYEEFLEHILPYTVGEEPFLHVIHDNQMISYYLASVENTWDYMSVSTDDILWKKFSDIFIEVLNESEKLFLYSAEEKILAQFKGEKLFWSATIRSGMVRTLIMKAFYRNDENCQYVLDELVEKLFSFVSNVEQWKYISAFFPDLCEVSPKSILKRMEAEISEPTGLMSLFENQSGDILFGKNEYINILWGIEELLTQKEYVSGAFRWLLCLDNLSYEYKSNCPKDIFRKLFCAWYSFSAFQSAKEKIDAAELAMDLDQNAWDHIYNALPGNHNSIVGELYKPKYRKHSTATSVTIADVNTIAMAYLKILLRHMDFSTDRWEKLLKFSVNLSEQPRQEVFERLLYEVSQMSDAEIICVKDTIRGIIYRHRYFVSADWAINDDKILCYEELLEEIHAIKPEYEYAYLFQPGFNFPLLHPVPYDQEGKRNENEKKSERLRQEKMEEFQLGNYNLELLVQICSKHDRNSLGRALAIYWSKSEFDFSIYKMLIENQKSGEMALDYLQSVNVFDKTVFTTCLDEAKKQECGNNLIMRLYRIEAERTLELPLISEAEENIKQLFWRDFRVYINGYEDWALLECKKYGTLQSYLELLYEVNSRNSLKVEALFEHLIGIEKLSRSQDFQMIEFYLENLLFPIQETYMDNSEKCMQIAMLEMVFFNVLDWSKMKCFQKSIKQSPEIFAEMVSIIFKHQGENEIVRSEVDDTYRSNIYSLYNKAEFCPVEENGIVDLNELKIWIEKLKLLLENSKQSDIYGYLLGRLFSYSPVGEDGHEPCEAVRFIIERDADESMINEYMISTFNKRGIHTPDAGRSEHQIAERFRVNADYLCVKYPKTANIYYSLSQQYEYYSRKERERAENGWY